jgi:hypothetical protein
MRFDEGISLLFHVVLVLSNLDLQGGLSFAMDTLLLNQKKKCQCFFSFENRHSTSRSDA